MWSPDWEKWGRDRGTNETINPVMLGHMRPSVPTLKSKQDGFHIVVFSSVVLLLLWMEGNQRSRSVCQQVVVSGCIFCLVEVESRRKPYQHDTCVCVCLCVRVGTCSWCVRLFFVYTIYGCLRTQKYFQYGWNAKDALVLGDKAVCPEKARPYCCLLLC